MSTFAVRAGQSFSYRVNGGIRREFTFERGDFADRRTPTPDEIAAAIDARADRLTATTDAAGRVVLSATTVGSGATLEIELGSSTAAPALGLTPGVSAARGTGLEMPRLVSLLSEPFALERGAELMLAVDGRNRRVRFTKGFTPGKATAEEVAAAIEDTVKDVADAMGDGRVLLTGRSVGPDASLVVAPPRDARKPDGAAQLGFVGTAAASHPHRTEPPRIALAGKEPGVAAVSLVATVVELHSAAGVTRIPPGGAVPLGELETADPNLQRLVDQGVVRLQAGGGA